MHFFDFNVLKKQNVDFLAFFSVIRNKKFHFL